MPEAAPTTGIFTCKDAPIENHRPLKIRVIGAGIAGVYLGIRIPQRLRNVDLQIYEKNTGIGGTWWENRYPGCACDIPSHSYQYSFEPNKTWSGFYAPSQEICGYIQRVADKYGVRRFVKLSHKVMSCAWDDSSKKWHVTVEKADTGEVFEEEADIVVSARGNLNDFKWPDIKGFGTFKGKTMHSASWDDSYDFRNKKVGVIGGGSSSIQIVPVLQKIEGIHLSCFIRSKVWISNRFGDHLMTQMGLDPNRLEFTEEQLKQFQDPAAYRKFRKLVEDDGNMVHFSSKQGSDMQKMFMDTFSAITKERLAKKPELLSHFSPPFGVGCRRLTPGPGYLEALVEDNVDCITDEAAAIDETGAVMTSGRHIDLDVVCCATGFNTSSVPPFPVTGRQGVTLADKFSTYPQTYLSLAIDDFPNYFLMLGPNASTGAGSLTVVLEAQGDYVIKCARKLQKEDYVSMEPKAARVRDFSDYVGNYFKSTVYVGACRSWYKTEGGNGGRISGLWPGSIVHMMEALRAPRWEDYEWESREENRLRWLGNGLTEALLPGGDPSWYLNEEEIQVPPEGKPEDDPRYKSRPFSH
ncbi:flavin-binding monooxygenase [Grosmannia clavigera kw1407]|uniref:Flavin-binding monooxygenase n=1 Tax=Grosmannia clavigera (strain kw1407 / UAMH 11150) TaxID=655863 RepID=F0XL70_GROCL|nr:flavin-binding monooxygenase [Grosmannia clavigera kw1407]EFX01581.1 flavin-binding monooxygenase [Grosmannia clavigera kw1407]